MALDPLTWLLLSISIITAYCVALKLSEGPQQTQIKETPEPWPSIPIPREPESQAVEISADVIQAAERSTPRSQAEEQPENGSRALPETRNSSEEKREKSRGPNPFPNPNS